MEQHKGAETRAKPTAGQLAKLALQEAQRPELEQRQAAEQERITAERKTQAAALRAAKRRFNASPIPAWFPDVVWQFVERWQDLEVWQSGETGDLDMVRLALRTEDKAILFVSFKDWMENPDDLSGRIRGYKGQEVHSAADVGAALSDYRESMRWPESATYAD
jgi:hypothetical protein